ncbi:hypothetical protein [Saccharothrix sp. Mg75]|uniref:hypothetical protein n=1 Tax=Saccharothrix sp. Mg75 TaxID=3445357 RepID=UPI003EEE6FB2
MPVPRNPARWALVLLLAGLAAVAAAVALWWPHPSEGAERAEATVTAPASCGGGGDAYDRVELKIGDQVRTARLDGCGHSRDERVEVVVPADTAGDFLVQAAASAPAGLPFANRLTALLLCLSGLAGGLYAHLLTGRPQPTAAAGAA